MSVIVNLVKMEGVAAAYAGLSASLMRQAIYGTARIGLHRTFSNHLYVLNDDVGLSFGSDVISIFMMFMDYVRLIFLCVSVCREKAQGGAIPFWMKTLSGMASGGIAVCIGTPFDVALVRMQADSMKPLESRRNYKNVFDAIGRIAREEGPKR